jgi:hypothetical protein
MNPEENHAIVVDINNAVRMRHGALKRFYRENPARLIQAYVGHFLYKKGRATVNVRPDDSLLELLAEGFRRYWRGKGSLDRAFNIVEARGKRSLRVEERTRTQQFQAQLMYEALRREKWSQKKAIKEIAKDLKCGEAKIRGFIFRKG